MKPGVYSEISNADYHGGPGISKSGLDLIHRSPMHFKWVLDADNDNTPTTAQALGTAAHSLILEPAEFVKQYCLALRPADVPNAIDDRDQLVAMVQALNAEREAAHPEAIRDADQLVTMLEMLNEGRLPKLPTGGTKAELVDRILQDQRVRGLEADGYIPPGYEELEAMKGPELKAILEAANAHRPGLLSTSGSTKDLAQRLRDNGAKLTLWSEVLEQHLQQNGVPYIGNISGSRHDMAAWLRANGVEVTLWSDVQAEWLQNNASRTVLTPEQWEQLHAMRDAVMAHPAAHALLTGCTGKAELSVYWNDPVTGELCRCRPDWWRDDDLLVDLKTTEDASPEGFAKSIANWRYDVQDPFYTDGVKLATGRTPRGFVFIAVEKKPPYAVGVYVLDEESRELGRAQYQADLQVYAECVKTNTWPGYGDKIQSISVPGWHANRNKHLLDGVA